jgi:hypothetical protein
VTAYVALAGRLTQMLTVLTAPSEMCGSLKARNSSPVRSN